MLTMASRSINDCVVLYYAKIDGKANNIVIEAHFYDQVMHINGTTLSLS